jgi:secreted PhoX family phosphatase
MRRRSVLSLLGLGGVGVLTAKGLSGCVAPGGNSSSVVKRFPFQPVRVPLPVNSDGLQASEQQSTYRELAVEDRLTVPEGFQSQLLAAWGDRLGDSRFGFNNDHLGFVQHAPDLASMTVNFEYISAVPWVQGFAEVVGRPLPFAALVTALQSSDGVVDCTALPAGDRLLQQIRTVADEAMTDLGIGVMTLQRDGQGQWERAQAPQDRRITGISGLNEPDQQLLSTGPASAVFRASNRQGYDDGLGDRIVGTFANCGGGTTPWGTVLSAEENFQSQVPEPVYADGSAAAPSERPFVCKDGKLGGLGNVYGLAGNKYGWMVEVDPTSADQSAVKHTALGRFRHEAVAVRAEAGKPLQVYSGCDRRGGHLYRFVSAERVETVQDKRNSRLFEAGELQVARFRADGSGEWLAVTPDAVIDPFRPSRFSDADLGCPVELPHRDRSQAGAELFREDAAVEDYCRRFATLSDLYRGEGEALQGAILVDAHLAASAIGATPTARPEDTKIDPISGDLLIAFTSGSPGNTGGADPAVFKGPDGQSSWANGWVMRLSESGENDFTWRMAVTGGTPWAGGLGFTNPDNVALDRKGNLWIVTDRSMRASAGDVFGNNSCWFVPRSGNGEEQAACFATGPMECEVTGVCLDQAEASLFLAVQHPGEVNGSRSQGDEEIQAHELVDRDGGVFQQLRTVPLGSNWPAQAPGRPPRPGVVAIQRSNGQPLLEA